MSFEVEETKEAGPTQRRDKGKVLYLPDDGAEHYSKPEYINQAKPQPESTAPRWWWWWSTEKAPTEAISTAMEALLD